MSANTLGVDVQPKVPRSFIRGQDLEFVMELPCDVPANYFQGTYNGDSVVTTLTSELRSIQNDGPGGLIATLDVAWEDIQATKLRIKASNTDNWPLGPAEFDVVFVRTATPAAGTPVVRKIRSNPVRIQIVDGVTK